MTPPGRNDPSRVAWAPERPGIAAAALVGVLGLAAMAAGCEDVCTGDDRWYEGQCRSRPPACGEPAPDCDGCAAPGASSCCPFPSTCWCQCPSGDAGCPCWDDSHCQGLCVNDDPTGLCGDKTEGTCSAYTSSQGCGCHCVITAGQGVQWCWD